MSVEKGGTNKLPIQEVSFDYETCELHQSPKSLFCDALKETLCHACATTPKYNKYYTVSIDNLKEKSEKCYQGYKERVEKLNSGLEELVEKRKEEIIKINEQTGALMKEIDDFYNKITDLIEKSRKDTLGYLEAKEKYIEEGICEDISSVEQFIEETSSFKERFGEISHKNVNKFTEELYKIKDEIETLEIKRKEVTSRCGKTYEIKFLRSDDNFNMDIHKCIESINNSFVFIESYGNEYLSPEDFKEKPVYKEVPYEYKGKAGFGLREKDYYNQSANTFHTDVEAHNNTGEEYKHFFNIMKEQPERLKSIQKKIANACLNMRVNACLDTEKRNKLFEWLMEEKIEIMNKFSDLVVQLYETRDKMLEDLDAEFNRRNDVYEKTLKEEKIWLREGLNIKYHCEEIAIWYKHACESWDKSNKSIQEYIQLIGDLERRKNALVTKKNEFNEGRNISFRMKLSDNGDFTTLLPRIEFIEFDEKEERAERETQLRIEIKEQIRKEKGEDGELLDEIDAIYENNDNCNFPETVNENLQKHEVEINSTIKRVYPEESEWISSPCIPRGGLKKSKMVNKRNKKNYD